MIRKLAVVLLVLAAPAFAVAGCKDKAETPSVPTLVIHEGDPITGLKPGQRLDVIMNGSDQAAQNRCLGWGGHPSMNSGVLTCEEVPY